MLLTEEGKHACAMRCCYAGAGSVRPRESDQFWHRPAHMYLLFVWGLHNFTRAKPLSAITVRGEDTNGTAHAPQLSPEEIKPSRCEAVCS